MTAPRERAGHPTQFHGVPVEERAFDSQGNRLPWALEWAEYVFTKFEFQIQAYKYSDHPNARNQKRQPEEKGSFGKSTRRQGSSRATRTQTPAKKENPPIDGFDAALKFDAQHETNRHPPSSNKVPPDGNTPHQPALNLIKEPSQVILYGYSPGTQWSAISFYESVSLGLICEDYSRKPPIERRRYQNNFEDTRHVHARPLTKAEEALAFQYRGGECWIKVTFDSIEAAERAIHSSPHAIQGHWIYAKPYRGQGPPADEPILLRDEDRQQGALGAPKPMPSQSQTLGPSFSMPSFNVTNAPTRANATLPRSFTTGSNTEALRHSATDEVSISSSTASSATATALDYPSLQPRNFSQSRDLGAPAGETNSTTNLGQSATFTHFPDTPRTILRPASEAFLPQKSWTETVFKRLTWFSPDYIGNSVPRLENGEFDWSSATLYWKLFYWVDTLLGTDWCGMKEN